MSGAAPGVVETPLAGASAGATVAVRGLLTGTMAGPRAWFFREGRLLAGPRALGLLGAREPHCFPVAAFLIEHPTAGAILLDTGFARGACDAPSRHLGWVGTRVFKDARASPSGTAVEQLRKVEADVQLIVMTHLHWDHASALGEFPHARVLVTREEWAAAHRPLAHIHGYLRRHLRGCGEVGLIDFRGPGVEGLGAFRRTIDLFGDGSVRLISTPGHSPGHLSALLRLDGRLALLAGDALYTMLTLRERHHPWQLGNARAYHDSFAEIEAFARANPDALIIPGHDLPAWEQSAIEGGL